MPEPRSQGVTSFQNSLSLFDRLNFLSIAITALLGCAVYGYCQHHPLVPYVPATRTVMNYLGLIHFAVAYQFFFTSPTVRPQLLHANPNLLWKLIGCVLLSVPFSVIIELNPIVFLFFYLHAMENAGYHIFKLSTMEPHRDEGVSVDALFPLLLVLALVRLSPSFLLRGGVAMRLTRLALLVGTVLFLRRLLPTVNWRQGWAVVRRFPYVIGSFIAVSLFMPEGGAFYNFFIIWHYVIWVVYTWVSKPQDRWRLAQSHVLFLAVYTPLFWLADAGIVLWHPLVLPLLVGPISFQAQSVCHFLFSFVFRRYPTAQPH